MPREWGGEERRKASRIDLEQIEHVVSMTVLKTLTAIGFDMDKPIETQKDIAHLRKWRIICDLMVSRAILACAAIAVSGIIGAAWVGFKAIEREDSKPERPSTHYSGASHEIPFSN